MARNAEWKGASQVLSDLGTRNMQLLISEPPKPLNRGAWINLKKRFMRQFSPRNGRVVAAITKRVNDKQALLDAFSWPEKRLLLSLLVPSNLVLSPWEEAQWNSRTKRSIQTNFLDRFESVEKDILRRFLNGEDVVPGGMTTVAAKAIEAESAIEDDIKSLKARQLELHRCLRKCKRLQQSLKPDPVLPALKITKSIETEHYHDGHSTYAEPTTLSIQRIAKMIPPLGSEDVILDLGSGAATTLWHLCQHHKCKGIGIEYGGHRLQLAATFTVNLIRDNAKYPSFNPNVINTHGNIMTLSKLPPCTVLYLFDEAFPSDLMTKIFMLINDAPAQLKYIFSSKGGRHAIWKGKLMEACHGVSSVSESIQIRKIGSGEGSSFQMYARNIDCPSNLNADMGSSIYTDYFNSTTKQKIEYYQSLAEKLALDAEASKLSRKIRSKQ